MLNKNKLKHNVWFYGREMKISPFQTNVPYSSKRGSRKVNPTKEIAVNPQFPEQPKHMLGNIFEIELFRCVRPLIFVMAVYGVVPMTLRPVRLSCHPLRSTMIWVVVVNLVVGWSVFNVVTSLSTVLLDSYSSDGSTGSTGSRPAPSVDMKLFAVQGIVHISSHFLLVIMWIELPYVRKRLICWDKFFEHHGSLVSGLRVSRRLCVVSWLVVAHSLLVFPAFVLFFIGMEARKHRQAPAHVYQIVLVSTTMAVFSLFCYTIRDLAQMLSQKLERELSARSLSAERLKDFRVAWISLRELLKSAGAMPACGMFIFGYLLTMITLSAFQSLAAMQRGMPPLVFSSAALLLHSMLLLLWGCDSAHQAKIAVNSAVEPLMMGEWTEMSEELRLAHQQLQNLVQAFPACVSFAGYFKINRSAFLTMIASVITYVIVLIQFRNDDDSASSTNGNSTETIGSYLALNEL